MEAEICLKAVAIPRKDPRFRDELVDICFDQKLTCYCVEGFFIRSIHTPTAALESILHGSDYRHQRDHPSPCAKNCERPHWMLATVLDKLKKW
jgi:hypothetical protein